MSFEGLRSLQEKSLEAGEPQPPATLELFTRLDLLGDELDLPGTQVIDQCRQGLGGLQQDIHLHDVRQRQQPRITLSGHRSEIIERDAEASGFVRLEARDHITIGLQCGGSDGYSGISANPALGVAVDMLVAHGGSAILSETPEIYGAEHLLTRRAVRPDVAHKLIERIKWWEHYTAVNEGEMNNNPSPGNKAGGLTTILAVYEYGEAIDTRGFVFMDTPGYDPVSATGQVAGGANMICFTTGRGSAYGCAPSPSLKLATNTRLWQRQEDDMDINCGEIVDGTASVAQMGEKIFELVLATASGRLSKSEQHGYGQNEFVPWQLGAVM